MFKINKLTMVGCNGQTYTYIFEKGINYIKGKNSSGKTEFYRYIDYMFGASYELGDKPWFKGTLDKGIMEFTYGSLTYRITRTMKATINYFSYSDEEDTEAISFEEYKDKLNSVFAVDKESLIKLHDFADEELTYRTFTVFSFLGEIRQGVLADFFDKCDDIRYSIKMSTILNFIFNQNPERLFKLKKDLEILKKEIRDLESVLSKEKLNSYKINVNLQKLNIGIAYNGRNNDIIKKKINEIKNMDTVKNPIKSRPISDLEVVHNNLDEQIKIYENRKVEMKAFQRENENREKLLENLHKIIEERDDFKYLVDPLISLVDDLKNSISFSKYIISDETVQKLIQQRDKVKEEILKSNNKYKKYELDDKAKAIAIIEDCFDSINENVDNHELDTKKKKALEIREEIKNLSKADDYKKVEELSKQITMLYKSAFDVSDIVKQDFNDKTFNIKYFKRGNLLQTMIIKKVKNETGKEIHVDVIQPTGSLARHTLIQLCGYLAFLDLLIREGKYPIIPILVLDHISKPFDTENPKAIGSVLEKAYTLINKANLQTFIFDDADYEDLRISPDNYEELFNTDKSGFNPFYQQEK